MASELMGKWLKHYDTIHRGWTPEGIANGVCATNGFAFPRVAGGYNLYRRVVTTGFEATRALVGASGRDSASVGNFSWRPHGVDRTYAYSVRAVGGGGVESVGSSPERFLAFDGSGTLLGMSPNTPAMVTVLAVDGGRFLVRWVYPSRIEEERPDHFEVCHFSPPGVTDPYAPNAAIVPYRRGRYAYSVVSAAFGHGEERRWRVRAVTAGGVDDGNDTRVAGFADADAPVAPDVMVSCLSDVDAG